MGYDGLICETQITVASQMFFCVAVIAAGHQVNQVTSKSGKEFITILRVL